MVGVFPLHKLTKMRDRMINDSAILRDSIGAATILKYIPHDKRLEKAKLSNFECKRINIETIQELTDIEMHKLMDELLKKCIDVSTKKKILKV